MSDSSRPDAIVVGAGIVGAACAYYLSLEGFTVWVVDSGFAGSGTTSAGMGHLAVMDDSEAEFELCRTSCALWAELAPRMSPECEQTTAGCLWIAETDEQMKLILGKVDYFNDRGVHVEALDSQQLRAAEPELRAGLPGALLHHDDRIIYQLGATQWLLDLTLEDGGRLLEGIRVDSIGARRIETSAGTLEADIIVNAAGVRAVELTPELRIEPRKGHLVITDRYPGFCRHQVMEVGYLDSAHSLDSESVAFNVQPRTTGQLLIGSSRELVGWDRSLNRDILGKMLRRADEFLPRLAELSCLRIWTGLRPSTPDHLPYIGRWPEVDGLWIAAGHEGLGIMTATGTGRLLADLVTGGESHIDASPFDPTRVREMSAS